MFDFGEFPILKTTRLTLRQVGSEHTSSLMQLFSDPRVLEFLNSDPMDTPDKADGFVHWVNEMYEKKEALNWAITSHDGAFIGLCGLYQWDRGDRRMDLGYHILPDFWRQGYATEATHAMLGWAFEALDLHRIQADCTDGHKGSEGVLLKCGFTLEGIWRESCWEHGRFVNIRQFGILRREYLKTEA